LARAIRAMMRGAALRCCRNRVGKGLDSGMRRRIEDLGSRIEGGSGWAKVRG
jgi:hypothetical protein